MSGDDLFSMASERQKASFEPLAVRMRPQTLDEIYGQEQIVGAGTFLRAMIERDTIPSLLLYGPSGVGKTTLAHVIACETNSRFVRLNAVTAGTAELRKVIQEAKDAVHLYQRRTILFIDEIGELDEMLQNKLLKVLEDKRARFDSAYYDPTDENIPTYIRKLFDEGAPADFVLIGATTRDAGYINPALRSRCAEIYFEPLTPQHIQTIVQNAAAKLNARLDDNVTQLISEYTIEGRKAINILADAYSNALSRSGDNLENILITAEDIYTVAQVSRLTPYITQKASDRTEVGRIFGLGVAGFIGSVIEIEAVAFKAAEKGKGSLRFNQTAGSMAKDSVFNAAAVVRKLTGEDINDYDIHINIIGGGNIDGPSAGTAIMTAIVSAITNRPIRQDIAITGEISIQGMVRPVGGVFEKAYGARQAGIKTLIIPSENEQDIPPDLHGLDVHPVKTAQEVLNLALV